MQNNDLIKKYPNAWPVFNGEPCAYFECWDGWASLLEKPIKFIHDYNSSKNENEKIYISQIKEKFGTLRFYTNFSTDELDKLISEAEKISENTCEICGEKGASIGEKWVKVRCSNHVFK